MNLGLLPTCLHRAPRLGKHMPHVPTTAERLRAWHNAREPEAGNHYPWPHLRTPYGSQSAANPPPDLPNDPAGCLLSEGERYAYEQTMDGRYPSDDLHYRG